MQFLRNYRNAPGSRPWRYYSDLYSGSFKVIPLSVLSGVAQSAILFPIAFLVREVFDHTLRSRNFGTLALIGAAVLCLYLLSGGAALLTQYLALQTTQRATQRLRTHMLRRIYELPRAYLTSVDSSVVHDNIVQNTQRVDTMSTAILALFLPSLLTSLTLAAVLLYLDPLLFAVMIGVGPILLALTKMTAGRYIARVHGYYRAFSAFSSGVLFVLQMLDLTRVQTAEPEELERQGSRIDELRAATTDMTWLQAVLAQVQKTIIALSGVIILVVGGSAVATDHLTIGQLVSFYVVAALLQDYIGRISLTVPQILAGHEALVALHTFVTLDESLPYSGKQTISFSGAVEFRDVSFGYNRREVLTEFNLAIHPQDLVAIVGPNGAGKSTIINLLLGFYRPACGDIYIDGLSLDRLNIDSIRRQIGVIMQDPLLFPGTILENITYGARDVEMVEVLRAARLATADQFIQALPEQYETYIGERGVLMSGGQRQRIAIARALLRSPALLLLDEPTNHLDHEAVQALLTNLRQAPHAPTTVVISHDLSVVNACDIVYYLEDGSLTRSHPDTQRSAHEPLSPIRALRGESA